MKFKSSCPFYDLSAVFSHPENVPELYHRTTLVFNTYVFTLSLKLNFGVFLYALNIKLENMRCELEKYADLR